MLRGEELSFGYAGGPPLFERLEVALAPGARLGLAGPSGSGKTTLGRLLAGQLTPWGGRVTLDGAPLPRRGPRPVQRAPQSAELAVDPLWTTARILANGGPPDPDTLDVLGIGPDWLDRRPAEMSGGELQRVALARLLGPATRYLICDEITAHLDALGKAVLWDRLIDLARRRGIGVLVISHDADLLALVTTAQVALRDLAQGGSRPSGLAGR